MRKSTVKYSKGEIGRVRIVEDFLPSPEQLVLRELPFDVTPVHVDALWRRRGPHPQAYDWLLRTLTRAAEITFADGTAQVALPG